MQNLEYQRHKSRSAWSQLSSQVSRSPVDESDEMARISHLGFIGGAAPPKKNGGFGGDGFEAPIMAGLGRIPRVPICWILHGLIACDLPKTEPWKSWELVNDNLVMGQGGASHNREICAWRISPSFSHGIKVQFNFLSLGTT